jgi:anti-sigma regulatory factor (Ser/Thr protein kinase)
MNLQLRFHLPEVTEQIGLLRDKVVQHLSCLNVEPDDIEDVRIILTELAANAIEHGYSGNGYHVCIRIAGETLTISVTDSGKGFPKEYPLPGTLRAKVRKSLRTVGPDETTVLRYGGWGLPLVCAAADRLEVLPALPHGTTVRVTKAVRYAPSVKERGLVPRPTRRRTLRPRLSPTGATSGRARRRSLAYEMLPERNFAEDYEELLPHERAAL